MERDECELNGGIWKGCCTGCFSPILIDVAGNGFNLTDGNNGVDLDLLGTGTKDKVAWTAPNTDDAWLVLDRNHNGTIDSALELFGNFTEQPQTIPVKDVQSAPSAPPTAADIPPDYRSTYKFLDPSPPARKKR